MPPNRMCAIPAAMSRHDTKKITVHAQNTLRRNHLRLESERACERECVQACVRVPSKSLQYAPLLLLKHVFDPCTVFDGHIQQQRRILGVLLFVTRLTRKKVVDAEPTPLGRVRDILAVFATFIAYIAYAFHTVVPTVPAVPTPDPPAIDFIQSPAEPLLLGQNFRRPKVSGTARAVRVHQGAPELLFQLMN